MTRATTKARQARSSTTWPKIRSTLATGTPEMPWTIVQARSRCHSLTSKLFHLLRPFRQRLNVVFHNGYGLLEPIGTLNQGVVFLDVLRQQIDPDLHHRSIFRVGAQHAHERDDTADKGNNNRFQATS